MPLVGSLGICTVAAVDVRSIGGGSFLPWASAWGFFYILDFEKVTSPENPGLGGNISLPLLFALLRNL